jgi:hypothetical protein
MADKNKAVFGIYSNRLNAERGVDALAASGFSHSDISVLLPDQESTREFAHEKNTKAPEGATAGAVSGGALGGTFGFLAGVGALAIPGVGPFIAAGPLLATFGGIGIGASIGGVTGALVGMGMPEYEAKRYEGRLKEGGILLSVHCDTGDEISRAKDVLKRSGAEDVSVAGEKDVDRDTGDVQTRDARGERISDRERERRARETDPNFYRGV